MSSAVVQVQIIHRHGARTNAGALTPVGKAMLVQLGNFTKAQFAAELQLPAQYDYNVVESHSSDVPRTIQSADSFLRGLFPDDVDDGFDPVIHTKPKDTDTMLIMDGVAAFQMRDWADPMRFFTALDQFVLSTIPITALQQMGKEMSINANCSGASFSAGQCGVVSAYVAENLYAANTLEKISPTAMKYYRPQLVNVIRQFGMLQYSYNISSPFSMNAGALGQDLANQILANAEQNYNQKQSPAKLYEFSGHDTTVMPLLASFGLDQPENMAPMFGNAIIFQTIFASGSLSLQATIGTPEQKAGSGHQYTFIPLQLRCIDSSGNNYVSTTCSIADVRRYVATRNGKVGFCYVSGSDLEAVNCSTTAAPDPNSAFGPTCVWYRRTCPLVACPSNYVVYPGDYSCRKLLTD